jgi:DNA-binding MarR family transcriptional regulator
MPSDARPKPEVCNCLALREATRHVTQFYDRWLASSGLRTTQFSILIRLRLEGPMTINALAKSLVMDRTTLGRNILPLEREGLIEIVPDSVDRRSKVVRLTEAQKKFETSFGGRRAAQLRALLHAVTETELDAALRGAD